MSANDNVGPNYYKNRNKKKKKNKFFQNAKSFGRKNSFGRGIELEQEDYNYFLEILNAMNSLEDDEARETMATNVYEQVKGKEIKISSNQLSSRVLENLLGYTDAETLEYLMEVFCENFRVVSCDKFASHVLQKMLFISLLRGVSKLQDESSLSEPQAKKHKGDDSKKEFNYNMKTDFSAEHTKKCSEFVERLSKFMLNNLEEFAYDAFGNYVIRQCLLNLAGVAELKLGKSDNTESHNLIVPDKWGKIIDEYASRLIDWPQFVDFPYDEYTSVLLQNLLTALGKSDESKIVKLGEKLLNQCFICEVEGELPKVFTQDPSVRLLEVTLSVLDITVFNAYYEKLFKGRLKVLSQSRTTNFAVQKFLDFVPEKSILEEAFDELEDEFENILKVGHTGVLASLSKACAKLCCQQGKFVKLLLQALHCTDASADKVIMSILKLTSAADDEEKTENNSIHLHGSIIMQSILEFNKPIKIVTSLLEMKNDKLAKVFCDPKGSHVANAFIASKFVGEKSREKLVRYLEGNYLDLALSAHGSRVLELLYATGTEAQQVNIVKELSERVSQLNSKPWGAIINKKLLVDIYRRNPTQWKSAIKADVKIDKLFNKILK